MPEAPVHPKASLAIRSPSIGGRDEDWLPGLSFPGRRLSTGFLVQEIDWRDHPQHDEAWADAEAARYGGRTSPFWLANHERLLVRGGQPVYPMLAPDIHQQIVSAQQLLSGNWTLFRSLDHGIRHPTCCAWAAVNRQGDVHVYREYYAAELPLAAHARLIAQLTNPRENIRLTVADPSLWERTPETLKTVADLYREGGIDLLRADNALEAGVESVTTMLVSTLARVLVFRDELPRLRNALKAPTLTMGTAKRLADSPALTFSPAASRIFSEMMNWRYVSPTGNPRERAAPSRFVDLADEGPDVVRYLCQSPAVRWSVPKPKLPTEDVLVNLLTAAVGRMGSKEEV